MHYNAFSTLQDVTVVTVRLICRRVWWDVYVYVYRETRCMVDVVDAIVRYTYVHVYVSYPT